jgi:hypothetical protein
VVSSRAFRLWLAVLAALYVAQGIYFARTLVPVHDAVQYLLVGVHAVRGEVSIFDDRFTGNRMPLPFFVLGLTQVVAGPSLLIPRLLNVAFGLGTLFLVIALARRLGGDTAGLLAGAFLATQGVVVAYYSYEGYPAFAALTFTAGVAVLFAEDSPRHRLLGTALVGVLFFVRTNLWPAIPFLLGHALWRASGRAERALLMGAATIPPLAYLAWDPSHLKILAYAPVVQRLVAPLGYVASVVLDAQETLPWASQLWQAARLVRRYEFWALAVTVLLGLLLWRRMAGGPVRWPFETRRVVILAALLVYMLTAQLLMFRWTWKWVGLYFVTFAPLVPILLGAGFSAVLAETPPRSWQRRLLVLALGALLLPPLYFVRNPLLPIGEVKAGDPFGAAHAAAAHLQRVVPPDAKVFFYGLNTVYYLSGLPHTYLQQIYKQDQFAMIETDDWVLRRSGFVPISDMRYWLSTDADFAVIDTPFLDYKITIPSLGNPEQLMKDLLARHFELIDTVDESPFSRYAVYRRRVPQRSRPAHGLRLAPRLAPHAQVGSAERIHDEKNGDGHRSDGNVESNTGIPHNSSTSEKLVPDSFVSIQRRDS